MFTNLYFIIFSETFPGSTLLSFLETMSHGPIFCPQILLHLHASEQFLLCSFLVGNVLPDSGVSGPWASLRESWKFTPSRKLSLTLQACLCFESLWHLWTPSLLRAWCYCLGWLSEQCRPSCPEAQPVLAQNLLPTRHVGWAGHRKLPFTYAQELAFH